MKFKKIFKKIIKVTLILTFLVLTTITIWKTSQILNSQPDLSNLDWGLTAEEAEIKTEKVEREPKTKVEIRAAKLREAKKTKNFCSEEYIDFNNNYSGISVMEWFFANYSSQGEADALTFFKKNIHLLNSEKKVDLHTFHKGLRLKVLNASGKKTGLELFDFFCGGKENPIVCFLLEQTPGTQQYWMSVESINAFFKNDVGVLKFFDPSVMIDIQKMSPSETIHKILSNERSNPSLLRMKCCDQFIAEFNPGNINRLKQHQKLLNKLTHAEKVFLDEELKGRLRIEEIFNTLTFIHPEITNPDIPIDLNEVWETLNDVEIFGNDLEDSSLQLIRSCFNHYKFCKEKLLLFKRVY